MASKTPMSPKMEDQPPRHMLGALVLTSGPLTYLAAEAITASAWRHPRYSYTYNYISDLGVPGASELQGRVVDSRLSVVMNCGFIAHGLLVFTAVLILRSVFTAARTRRVILGLVATLAIGISLVGIFHGSEQAVANGTILFHAIGALCAIVAGNTAAILMGVATVRGQVSDGGTKVQHRAIGGALMTLGTIGIAAYVTLMVINGSQYDGAVERVAVYTILASELLAAASVVRGRRADHSRLPRG